MKRSLRILSLSSCFAVCSVILACGSETNSNASAQSLQNELESARQLVVKCNSNLSAEAQLARELSKTCRQQNAQLKAQGLAACNEDLCSDVVTLTSEPKGLEIRLKTERSEYEFLVNISTDISLAKREKSALICYAPVLKARELINSLDSKCL